MQRFENLILLFIFIQTKWHSAREQSRRQCATGAIRQLSIGVNPLQPFYANLFFKKADPYGTKHPVQRLSHL